jgi:hypothetical protein
MRTTLVVLSLCMAGGCASGPTTWRQVTTPHFLLRTDQAPDVAMRSARALEGTRAALISAAWPGAELPETERAVVYVFADRRDFQEHFGSEMASVVQAGNPTLHFLSGEPEQWEVRKNLTEETTSYIRFQIAFQLVEDLYPDAPLWLTQGLALFLDTIHQSEDGKSVIMGAPNPTAMRNYKAFRSVTLAQMMSWDNKTPFQIDGERRGIEGLSWVFVHWLFNTHAEAFAHYQQDLSRGVPAAQAFAAAFPGFDPGAADKEIFAYSKHGAFTEMAAALVEETYEPNARELSAADLHVMAAHVARMKAPPGSTQAVPAFKTEMESALALDATNADAIVEQTWLPPAERLAGVRAATAAHPGDERLWKLLGDLLRDSAPAAVERAGAYRKAAELAPRDPSMLTALAWELMPRSGAEALQLARRALRLAPSDPNVLHTYAAASFITGSCQEAIASEQRAASLHPAGPFATTAADYNARCSKPAARPPARKKR